MYCIYFQIWLFWVSMLVLRGVSILPLKTGSRPKPSPHPQPENGHLGPEAFERFVKRSTRNVKTGSVSISTQKKHVVFADCGFGFGVKKSSDSQNDVLEVSSLGSY